MRQLAASATLVVLSLASSQVLADDAGKVLFTERCGVCHTVATAKSGFAAPSLKGVYERKIASLTDFSYSTALKSKEGKWTDANLETWLSGPGKFAPGTKMFIAPPAPADRAAIISFLKTAK